MVVQGSTVEEPAVWTWSRAKAAGAEIAADKQGREPELMGSMDCPEKCSGPFGLLPDLGRPG